MDAIETQVRHEFLRKHRAQEFLIIHALLTAIAVALSALGIHWSWYYYTHGKGSTNRETLISQEVEHRSRLLSLQAPTLRQNDYDNPFLDDDELFYEDKPKRGA